jgi:hypothetical protein
VFAWATLIIGLTLLFAVAFFPFFFFLAWLIAAGVLMMWQTWVEMGGSARGLPPGCETDLKDVAVLNDVAPPFQASEAALRGLSLGATLD